MSQNTGKMAAMIEQAERDLLHTYNRYQVVLDHGEGVYLYDVAATATSIITTLSRRRSTGSCTLPTISTMSRRSKRLTE